MPNTPPIFDIDDAQSFDSNLKTFLDTLEAHDPALAAVMRTRLPELLRAQIGKTALWDALLAAASKSDPL
jgi:hypothetical protein